MALPIQSISFPFRLGNKGLPEPVEGAEAIAQNVLTIMMTIRGERIMRPEFGSDVASLTFEPNNEALPSLIRSEVQSTLGTLEPRISVIGVDIRQDDPKLPADIRRSHVIVEVLFKVTQTGELGKVSLPLVSG